MGSSSRARVGAGRAGAWPNLALAAALTLGGQLELAFSGVAGWHGLAHGMLLLGQTAPVAVRRAAPTTAAVVGATALLVEALATTATNTLSGLLAGLVLIYSVGRYVAGRRLLAVTAGVTLAVGVHIVRLPGPGWQVSDLAFAAVFSAAALLGGRTMRRRELERRRAAADLRAEQAAAAAAVHAAVADERSRIARELHDVVAHGMGVMVVQAAAAEQLLAIDPAAARQPLTTVRQAGQDALAEMRRLLGLLRAGGVDDTTEPQPGLDRLPALVERLQAAGMPVTLTARGEPAEYSDGLQLCAYRIVQEALTNCLTHATGAATRITLDYGAGTLDLIVRNDPGTVRPAPDPDGTGHGLVGMRERVRLYGGTLSAGPQPDGGFLVHASLPVGP